MSLLTVGNIFPAGASASPLGSISPFHGHRVLTATSESANPEYNVSFPNSTTYDYATKNETEINRFAGNAGVLSGAFSNDTAIPIPFKNNSANLTITIGSNMNTESGGSATYFSQNNFVRNHRRLLTPEQVDRLNWTIKYAFMFLVFLKDYFPAYQAVYGTQPSVGDFFNSVDNSVSTVCTLTANNQPITLLTTTVLLRSLYIGHLGTLGFFGDRVAHFLSAAATTYLRLEYLDDIRPLIQPTSLIQQAVAFISTLLGDQTEADVINAILPPIPNPG